MSRPPIEPTQPPRWHGDLDDDCTAEWAGLMLRAEWMDGNRWWWCVYDLETREQVAASHVVPASCTSGSQARHAAQQAASSYLDVKDRRRHWHPKDKRSRGSKSPHESLKRMALDEKPRRKRQRRGR